MLSNGSKRVDFFPESSIHDSMTIPVFDNHRRSKAQRPTQNSHLLPTPKSNARKKGIAHWMENDQ